MHPLIKLDHIINFGHSNLRVNRRCLHRRCFCTLSPKEFKFRFTNPPHFCLLQLFLKLTMDQESNQMEQHPVLCRNGCGFYSNNGTDGLCSVCYKDMIKKKQQPPTGMPATLAPTGSAANMASLSIEESSPAKTTSVDTAQPTVILPSAQQTEKVRIKYAI